ncbi:hypothetical protein QWJ17_00150 [Betaproteobacteria bacterium LSUCC0117]|nr:hypothetical protein [Betaproteobacteria bacterium LSUCC0117]
MNIYQWRIWLIERKLRTLGGIMAKYIWIFSERYKIYDPYKLAWLVFLIISRPAHTFLFLANIHNKKRRKIFLLMDEGDKRFELLSLKLRGPEAEVYWMPKQLLDYWAKIHFNDWYIYYRENLDPQKSDRYVNPLKRYWHKDNTENRSEYFEKCKKYITASKSLFSINEIILASADDTINFELINACNILEIKTVLCEREGTHTETVSEILATSYIETNRLNLREIYCANEIHLKCYEQASDRTTKLMLIGELRSDYWRYRSFPNKINKYKSKFKNKKLLTFLAFGERNYIEPMYHKDLIGNWNNLRADIEEILYELIRDNEDLVVVYKLGHREDYFKDSLDKFKNWKNSRFFDLDRAVDASELMNISNCVIGFQSTATVEALFYDAKVLYPYWAIPASLNPEKDMLPLHKYEKAFVVCRSKEKLKEEILEALGSNFSIENRQHRDEVINKYFYEAGNVADRLARELLI